MTRTRLIVLVAGVGLLVGLLFAVAIPRVSKAAPDRPFIANAGPLQTAPARQRERGPLTSSSVYLRAHPGTVRIDARRPDPAGGPDWVVRTFEADRMIPPASRRPGTDGVISVALCAQLGREVGGRFGWIDGTNTFRPVATASMMGAPAFCGSRKPDTRKLPELHLVTLVDQPKSPDPTVRGSIIWGLVGQRVDRAILDAAGQRQPVRRTGEHGAFLSFFGPSRSATDPRLEVTYPGGKRFVRSLNASTPPPGLRLPKGDEVVRGSSQVIARTSDPGGGPSWGARGIRTKKGDWCLGPAGYLVDDRIGEIDETLGTILELGDDVFPNGCPGPGPSFAMPVQAVVGSGAYTDLPQLDPGRSELRLQPGRTYLWGRARADVERITLTTPQGVRTIEPTDPANGFIVVYDGQFKGGDLQVTAHFENGREQTLRLDSGAQGP